MKLYSTTTAFIIEDGGCRLSCSKRDGKLSVDPTSDVIPMDAEELCDIVSVVGRMEVEGVNYLLLVSECSIVAEFTETDVSEKKHAVYRIDKVRALPLNSVDGGDIPAPCMVAESSSQRLKQGTGKLLKFMQNKIGSPQKHFALLDEILRLFNDHPSFYFCFGRDITHSTQRHFSMRDSDSDERFFWNRLLLKDLLDELIHQELAKKWIVPIVQGNISCDSLSVGGDPLVDSSLNITLISRRSVRRAGVRYLRRGIDTESNVANFVETELILDIFGHHLSFVQIRGSVPVFWSQKGFKYRPPLSIDKHLTESMPYFTTHMQELIHRYGGPLVAVNLVDQAGRELKLATSFLEHAIKMDCSDVHLISFDLHRHCRGLRFDKINDLISHLQDLLAQIGYCWVDKTGEVVKIQRGVVRTNCVDCLDRTNVVQGAISQWVCMQQAQRLGMFGPLCEPPEALVTLLQHMWADNGDAISTQYAGTAALKGDVTRSGERRITGIMKDGYNSASRYYLSHVRDSSRQKAINALLGYKDQGSESMVESDSDSEEDENVCRLVAETIHFLLPEGEVVVGGWALCDSQRNADAIDSILLLTRTTLYVALYDDDSEKLDDVKIVPLHDIGSIEIGRTSKSSRLHLRLCYLEDTFVWRAGRTRVFNNVAIRIRTLEEAAEYTESIAEQISITINLCIGKQVPVVHVERLSFQGSGNTARKALASVAAALRTRVRRPQATPTFYVNSSKCGEKTATDTDPARMEFEPIHTDHQFEASVEFRDDMNTNTAHVPPPPLIHVSPSDGCLLSEATRPTPSSDFTGRIRGLKQFSRSSESGAVANNPFESLLPLLLNSRTNFVML